MIRLENIAFSYGNKRIFEDFSLELADGARLALMGPSGCGKSTLLRLISGLLTPQSGRIAGLPQDGVAYVFQESRLLPQLTARENVELVLKNVENRQKLAEEILTELGLGDELDTLPSELSGGMARRVAMARALAFPSPLLVLDEAFTGLDERTRGIVADCVLRRLNGRTLVMSTHSEVEAELLGCEILRLAPPK